MMVGETVGRYRVLRKLGEGGMGEVFLARDTTLERDVAIKVLPAALSDDATARERFRREALAAAGLDHPFICKVFEIGDADGPSTPGADGVAVRSGPSCAGAREASDNGLCELDTGRASKDRSTASDGHVTR